MLGTFVINLPPHHWDCVKKPGFCKGVLPLIGVLSGAPLWLAVGAGLMLWWLRRGVQKGIDDGVRKATEINVSDYLVTNVKEKK